MTAARLAARCVDLLGPVDGPVDVGGDGALARVLAARIRVVSGDEAAAAAVWDLRDAPSVYVPRAARTAALAARLPAGAAAVVVDHNQPRAWWRRLVGVLVLAVRGLPPSRARRPTARELAAGGFAVEALRLLDGERLQLVRVRRRAS